MDKDHARIYIKTQLGQYLTSKGINIYRPFRCLNPNHLDQNPSMRFDQRRNKSHCFSCGADYDIFDIISIEYNLSDYREIFKKAYTIFNVTEKFQETLPLKAWQKEHNPFENSHLALQNENKERAFKRKTQGPLDIVCSKTNEKQDDVATFGKSLLKANGSFFCIPGQHANKNKRVHKKIFKSVGKVIFYRSASSSFVTEFTRQEQKFQDPTAVDASSLNSYCLVCHKRVHETDYLKDRGIGAKVTERFFLGFDPSYVRSVGSNMWRALIIPTGKESYVVRNTDVNAEKGNRYRKCGKSVIFNARALYEIDKPVFVVEGEIDALSIMEVGGEAVGLGSTANIRSFLELVERRKPLQPLLIALDNDSNGRTAEDQIMSGLKGLGVGFYKVNPYGGYKDANEALVSDREMFSCSVREVQRVEEDKGMALHKSYYENNAAWHLKRFWEGVSESVDTPCISTGFKKLDTVLDGGLYEGLYVIGAISSLGKTTLVMQIADQIATDGTDVLIFSLEMGRDELIAKSISRHTLINSLSSNSDIRNAKTARGITASSRYAGYTLAEQAVIQAAVEAYGAYAGHIYISEGVGDIGVTQVREMIQNHIFFTGRRPVVAVDYVQILAPYNERFTDKQNIDRSIMELKRVSRDFKIPVIGVSSFNRANYREVVAMEAYKESGAIEYSSDVLIGLQLKGTGERGFDPTEKKRKNPREIELVVLKNRNGPIGDKVEYEYYPLFSYWKEA